MGDLLHPYICGFVIKMGGDSLFSLVVGDRKRSNAYPVTKGM